MNIVTIPKKLPQKGDLVLIPKREYQEFSAWRQEVRVQLDERWFWTPEWQRKEQEADEAIRLGRITGPFSRAKELITALKRKNKA